MTQQLVTIAAWLIQRPHNKISFVWTLCILNQQI